MIILALDLATITGACDGIAETPRLWSWHLADGGESRPQRLLHLAKFLRKYFTDCPCDGVVYEAPMPLGILNSGPKFNKITGAEETKTFKLSEANVMFARGAMGVLEMTACEFGKPVESFPVQAARKAVLGHARNPHKDTKVKDWVVHEVTKIHRVDAETDNECDAWVLWQYAHVRANPRLAVMQTPLFGGALR
jgi:hypothetical protein